MEYNDKFEHRVTINVQAYNPLLSFEIGLYREIKIKEGKTIYQKILITLIIQENIMNSRKFYLKKWKSYLYIKLKFLRINLKFDKAYNLFL